MALVKRAIPALSVAAALILTGKNSVTALCESPPNVHSEAVKEPFTGIEFPRAKEEYLLLGTAVRCMVGQCKFAKARAYAVGLYLKDGDDAHHYINMNSSDEVFREVLRTPVSRRLVLVMDKDFTGHDIAKGFDGSLLPSVRKAQGGQKRGPGKDALREFTRCFNQEKMIRKGTEVSLEWRPDDSLVISIDSSVRAIISSPILCHALFDMYLGPDSIFKRYGNMSFRLVEMTDLKQAYEKTRDYLVQSNLNNEAKIRHSYLVLADLLSSGERVSQTLAQILKEARAQMVDIEARMKVASPSKVAAGDDDVS